MKNTIINAIRFVITFIIVLFCLTTTCLANEITFIETFNTEDGQNVAETHPIEQTVWFYNQLNDMEKKIYDGFAAKRDSLLDEKQVYIPFAPISAKNNFTTGEFKNFVLTAQRAYLADFPAEKIWMDNCKLYLCYKDGFMQIKVKPQGKFNAREATETFEKIANDFVETLFGTDLEKLETIHNWLISNVKYDLNANNNSNIYGAIVERRSVCSGYAYSFKYLADKAGLNVVYVQGYFSHSYYHAWNMAEVNGEWILIDVTFSRMLKTPSLFAWKDSSNYQPDPCFIYPS